MRCRPTVFFPVLALSAAYLFAAATPVQSQSPPEDRARGVVLSGLKRSAKDGACRGKYELAHRDQIKGTTRTLCTHGPDPAPEGVDVRNRRGPQPRVAGEGATPSAQAAADGSASIPCYGTGQDGYRVQVIYARASNVADRYVEFAPSIVQWTAKVDGVVSSSAAETGGVRHVRFVTDANCNLVIDRVTLSPTGDDDLSNTISELRSLGYDRVDRKYLVYTDANVYCGIAQIYLDDSANRTPGANANNGHPQVLGTVARVDNGCWGRADSVEAHELIHNLGGVQESAPNSTSNNHCTDENDRMCYADGSGKPLAYVCPAGQENRFDCNHDDYFSTNPPLLSYLATHWNSADSAFLARAEPVPSGARYNPLTPARILDTRSGNGAPIAQLGGGGSLDLQVTGRGGVPASGVSAVVMNVTVTDPLGGSFVTVWPTGEPRPLASNLNFTSGQTVPNLVVVKVGTGGKVSLYNGGGAVNLIADVAGWYDTGAATTGARYNPLTPARILDTRSGNGAPAARVGPSGTVDLTVTGRGGVPASGVSAVVMNVTVTEPSSEAYLTAFPSGEPRPLASNLNFTAGQTVPNLVVVKVGTAGKVSLFNSAGTVHVIADVAGWYGTGADTSGALFKPVSPARILDTRSGIGAPIAQLGGGGSLDLQVTGRGGVPSSGVSAVVMNVTVTDPSGVSYATAWPAGEARPLASNLNFTGGQTVPNLVVVKVGAGGKVSLYNAGGTVNLIADVAGWYGSG